MPEPSNEIQRYLDLPLDTLMKELALHQELAGGGLERSPADVWRRLESALHQRVCVEWNWCDQRQDARFDDPTNIALALASIVLPDATRWQIPAALIAVIPIKRGLDAFCNCPPVGQQRAAV